MLSGLRARLLLVVLLPWAAAMAFVAAVDPRFHNQAIQELGAELALSMQLAQAEQEELVSVAREFLIMLEAFKSATGIHAADACDQVLARLHRSHPQFQNFGFLDRDGKVLCAALPTPKGASFSRHAFVSEALSRNAFALSDFQIGPVTKLPQIGFALPERVAGMPAARVLFVTAHLDVFRSMVQRARLQPGQDLLLTDSAGKLLFSHPPPSDAVGEALPAAKGAGEAAEASAATFLRPGFDGVVRLARQADIVLGGKTLHLSIGTPAEGIERRTWELKREELRALGLIGLGALLLAWYSAEVLVLAKIRRLRKTIEHWTEGNLQARAGFRNSRGEIPQLGRDLDAMAEALASLNRRHGSILDAAGEGIYGLDMTGRVNFINPAAAALLGYRPEELKGRRLCEFAGPSLHVERESGADFALELPPREVRRLPLVHYFRRNGDTIRADLARTGIYEQDRQVGVVDIFSDRSEFHRVIQALRESEEHLRAIIEAAPDAILIVRGDGRVAYLNEASARLLGMARNHLIESDLEHLLASEGWDTHPLRTLVASAAASANAQGIHIQTEIERPDGTQVPLEVGISHFTTREGGFVVAVARDITERKRAEAALREMNETLERRVQQRTAAIERAYRDLETFSYSVAHDLRAPLRAINGFTQLVLQSEGERFTSAGRGFFERVIYNARKMDGLIEDILRYSRSATGHLQAAEVDMNALAREVIDELREANGHSEVLFSRLPVVMGDAAMLRQVWVNLIGNAIKFSSVRENPRVEIGCGGSREQVFYVADNGIGFDMSHADRLFGMFQRMHAGEQFPGTGVGLAIVRRLIERHGGRIWAKAEPGKGATFYFTIETRVEPSGLDGTMPAAGSSPS